MKYFLHFVFLLSALTASFSGRTQNLPEQQCIGAIPVCQATYSQANSYSGFGATQELNITNRGCLTSNETNDVWYIINISTAGNLAFSITPNSGSDYDFGLWNITGGGCQTLYNGLTPVRCDFAGTSGATGISSTITGNGWQAALPVNAGETYLLNVSNFSPTQAGYLLSFAASTASIFDNQNPRFLAANTPCGASSDTVTVLMSEPVRCNSIAPNGSDFTITPAVPGITIQSAGAPNCASGGTASLNVRIKLSGNLPNGTYTLRANIGTDTNTLKDNCGNSQPVTDTVNFVVGAAPAPVYNLIRPATCAQRAVFSVTPSLAGTYTVTIAQAGTTIHTFTNVSGSQVDSLFPGTYTVTMSSSGCTLSGTFTINPGAAGPVATVATTASCAGSSVGTATATVTGGTTPYTYAWNTTPVRTTQTITGLGSGSYTVTVTDNAGCTTTASGTVAGSSNITVTMTKTDITCNGLTNGIATATPGSGTTPYTYSWNTTPGQTTQTATGLPGGTYTAVVTDANGCTGNGSITIIEPPALSTTLSQSAPISCNGGANGSATVVVTGGTTPYTHNWSNGQAGPTAANLTAGTYSVTVTDNRGCTKSGTVTVTQPSAITVATSTTTNPCAGVPGGSATATPAGGTPPYTYSWNTTPVQTTQTATGINSGTYTVTVRDANNCLKTATATVPQTPALSGTFTQVSQPLCPNVNNGSATYAATGGTQPYTYSWNNGQTGPTATGLAAGTHIVSVRDGSGCLHTASVNINNGAVLRTTIAATQASCFGASNGTATVTATGGQGPYTYSWATTPPQTNATATGLPAGSWIVSVRDALGCVVPDTAVIGQPAVLTATIQTVDVRCFNQKNGTATATVTGGTAPYTYVWNTIQVQTSPTATALDAGTYDVQITDSKGCTTSNTFTINQPTDLVLTTGVRGSNCLGQNNGRAYVSVTGGAGPYIYQWNTNPAQITDTAVGLASGSYAVTVTDRNGCQRTATAVIPTPVPLVATITIDQIPCPGRPEGKLTGQASGGSGAYSWSWNTVPAQTTQSISGLLPGLYTLTVSDSVQCVAIVNVNLPAHTPPMVSAGPDKTICSGQPVILEGSGTAITWNWNPATALSCITCLTPISSTPVDRQYVLSGTDANGCVASDTVQVRVINRQAVTVGAGLKICPGDSVQLLASGATRYQWSPAASLNDSTSATPTAKPVKSTRYRVVLSQDICYVDTLYQQVDVYDRPTVDLPETIASIYGGQVAIPALVTNATAITWSPATGLSCSACFEPIATVTGSITYTATVQNELGCATSDSVSILVNCNGDQYYFPTAFVPEGDGENRWFFPKSKEQGRIRSLKIYNRWGTLVFESGEMPLNNPQSGWDGRQKGQLAPQGVYVYMAEVQCDNGQTARLDGNVTLMR
ncbi:MAG: hypothetical protein EOP52_02735 [Sphingobacteriales bacterium]|nr:MAG: hypothetical protein EOP52_02735 [Sphingobacteriales bacterium]